MHFRMPAQRCMIVAHEGCQAIRHLEVLLQYCRIENRFPTVLSRQLRKPIMHSARVEALFVGHIQNRTVPKGNFPDRCDLEAESRDPQHFRGEFDGLVFANVIIRRAALQLESPRVS